MKGPNMSLAALKNEGSDIVKINKWLVSINETDQQLRDEVLNNMKKSNEYRIFILDYAKGLIK